MKYAAVTGWGKCLPSSRLSNQDISGFLDTSDEWIFSRTGIVERRISAVPVSDLAARAASNALDCAGIKAEDVDLTVLCTTTPDTLVPNAASAVMCKLQAETVPCFDINAACGGFLYALHLCRGLIASGIHQRILLIGAERLSWFQNWSQRETSVLFGDGAGALILQASSEEEGILYSSVAADASGHDAINVKEYGAGYNRYQKSAPALTFNFNGKAVFKRAVNAMTDSCRSCLERMQMPTSAIDLFIGHQANSRILSAVAANLAVSDDRVFQNLQHYGNTSAASIPIALCEALHGGRVCTHSNILLTAFGAGFSYGAALLRFASHKVHYYDPDRDELMQPQSALQLLEEAIASDCKSASNL